MRFSLDQSYKMYEQSENWHPAFRIERPIFALLFDLDLDNAIAVHTDWRAKLKTAAARHEQLDFETIGRDDCREIGKWLHGAGKSKHDGSPTFVDLIAKHKQFHQEASKVA